MRAYLLHLSTGGRPKAFLAKALDMAQHIEGVFAGCKDDRPPERIKRRKGGE
jgi:hypothetical protein